jgi:hypothetical protein
MGARLRRRTDPTARLRQLGKWFVRCLRLRTQSADWKKNELRAEAKNETATQETGDRLKELAPLENLQTLHFWREPYVTPAGVNELPKALPKCQILVLMR